MMNQGETSTLEIDTRKWTLVLGYNKKAKKYSAGVNGLEMSALPDAPKTAASYHVICKSSEKKKYSETIRSVTQIFLYLSTFVKKFNTLFA